MVDIVVKMRVREKVQNDIREMLRENFLFELADDSTKERMKLCIDQHLLSLDSNELREMFYTEISY